MRKLLTSALLISALAGSMALQASAVESQQIDLDKKGTLTLDLGKMKGGEVSIYTVAEVSAENGYHYDISKGQFADNKKLTEEAIASLEPPGTKWNKSPNNADLAKTLSRDAIGVEALDVEENSDGSVTFDSLVTGLYLVVLTKNATNSYSFAPFLISMPDQDGNYEVEGTPKPGIKSPDNPPGPSDEKVEATVCKVWNDENNKEGKRPSELKVTLSTGQSVTLNEANQWKATIKNLKKYDVNKKEIEYKWTEDQMPEGYTMTQTTFDETATGTITTITNTYNPPDNPPSPPDDKTELTIKKAWSDDDNNAKKRPEELKVQLLSNGTATGKEVTLNEANNWSAVIKDLPVKDSTGKTINYSWKEGEMPEGYKLTAVQVCDKDFTVTTLTNTYSPKEENPPKDEEKKEDKTTTTTTTNNTTNNTTTNNTTTNNTTTNNKTENNTTSNTSNTSSTKDVASEKLPQTGQLWWPVPLMAVMGLILLTAGIKRRRKA